MSDRRKKKSGIFVWIIMGLLVLGLGGFGLTGAFQTTGATTVATVGEEEITADAYLGTLQQDLLRAAEQFGQNITFEQARLFGLDQTSLRRQLTFAALANEARRLNLSVGDATVRAALLANPAFQLADGSFSEDTYDLVLNQQRMTRAEYEDLIRKDQTQTLLSTAISGAVGPQPTSTRVLMDFIGETRDLVWAKIDASALPDETPAPDGVAIQAYYDANPEAFTTPEIRKITYAMLTPDMVAAGLEISEEAIREFYEAQTDIFNTPEQRVLDRIVFANQQDAEDAMARINAGTAGFDDIAREQSVPVSEYALGAVRADAVSEQAAALLFATGDTGIFGPVESAFGPAIFRVNASFAGNTITLDEARPDIRDALAAEQASSLMLTKIGDIDDLIAGGATLEELADETEMELFTIDYSTDSTEEISTDPAFIAEATSAEPGEERDLIELSNGGILALRVDEVIPATLRSLNESRDQAVEGAKAEATQKRVEAFAEELAAQVEAGADLSATLGALGIGLTTESNVTRTSPPNALPPQVALGLFEQAEGEARSYPTEDGAIIVQVNKVRPFDPESDNGKSFLAQAEAQVKGDIASDIYILYANAVLDNADVTVNQGLIDQILASIGSGAVSDGHPELGH